MVKTVFVFLFHCGFLCGVLSQTRYCTKDTISKKVHKDFDVERFIGSGEWNILMYTGFVPVQGIDLQRFGKSDFKLQFERKDCKIKVKNVARVKPFQGLALSFCHSQSGDVLFPDKATPAKMELNYTISFGKQKYYGFDYWILFTDYTDLTVVYSCYKTLPGGRCREEDTYLWSLSKKSKHSVIEMKIINRLAKRVCIENPEYKMKTMSHNMPCKSKKKIPLVKVTSNRVCTT